MKSHIAAVALLLSKQSNAVELKNKSQYVYKENASLSALR